MAKLNNSHSQAALVNSITEGIKLQSQNRPQRSRKNASDPDTSNLIGSNNNVRNVGANATPSSSSSSFPTMNQTDSTSNGATRPDNYLNNSNGVPAPSVSPAASGMLLNLP